MLAPVAARVRAHFGDPSSELCRLEKPEYATRYAEEQLAALSAALEPGVVAVVTVRAPGVLGPNVKVLGPASAVARCSSRWSSGCSSARGSPRSLRSRRASLSSRLEDDDESLRRRRPMCCVQYYSNLLV